MLTNWNTIQNSIKRLKKLNDQLAKENQGFTKKEILKLNNELINLKNKIDIIEANTENLNLDDDVPPPHY